MSSVEFRAPCNPITWKAVPWKRSSGCPKNCRWATLSCSIWVKVKGGRDEWFLRVVSCDPFGLVTCCALQILLSSWPRTSRADPPRYDVMRLAGPNLLSRCRFAFRPRTRSRTCHLVHRVLDAKRLVTITACDVTTFIACQWRSANSVLLCVSGPGPAVTH